MPGDLKNASKVVPPTIFARHLRRTWSGVERWRKPLGRAVWAAGTAARGRDGIAEGSVNADDTMGRVTRRHFLHWAGLIGASPSSINLTSSKESSSVSARLRGIVETGLDVFARNPPEVLRDKRVGLVTNPSGVDPNLRSTVDLLAARRDLHLVALFGPEHSIRGNATDAIPSAVDAKTGLPVYSLYGVTKSPTPAMLDGVDALIFDIQDVGARFYTYISTLALAMQAAAASGLLFVVLDRPNPLGGQMVDGPIVDSPWSSFIGMYPIPVLHGMTIGELARLFNIEYGIGANLLVIPMDGWHRSMWFDDTGLPWVITSPNIPRFETALLYPALGPIGGTNLSVGVGTTKPFEFAGAPFVQPWRLRAALEARHPGGVAFRDAYWRGAQCTPAIGLESGGVEIRVIDRPGYRPLDLMIHVLSAVQQLYPGQLEWDTSAGGLYTFDLEMGTDRVRRSLTAGRAPRQIETDWQPDLAAFRKIRAQYLLYR
jgi:uncharacterized protein YbbC (DUF1343 family)